MRLERAIDRACGSRAIPGNAVTYMADGPELFSRLEALLDGAKHRVHFENYIMRDDDTGRRIADRLEAAAGRGVEVKVLYDQLGCRGTSRRYFRKMARSGVEVRAFNPMNPIRLIRSIQRNHRKYVAVDGERCVLGGFCVGDEWVGDSEKGIPPWRDTAIEMCGPAVPALELTFFRAWGASDRGRKPSGADSLQPNPAACGEAAVRVVEGTPWQFRLSRAAELLLGAATERIWITEAYLVPPASLYSALIATARDGVDVRLLLPDKSDIPLLRTLTRVGYRELLEAGVRIFEWRGPMLHAKTIMVDDQWFKVGSSNLNPSSLIGNWELDVLIQDTAVAATAAQQFRLDLSGAVEIVLKPRGTRIPLTDLLPPSVVPAGDAVAARGMKERRERAFQLVRHVTGGARRSIAGAFIFTTIGIGLLLLALPRIMAYVLAAGAFALAFGGAHAFLSRRRARED